jgi:hypothetical protein
MGQRIPNFPYIEESDGINEIELDEMDEDFSEDDKDSDSGEDGDGGGDDENSDDKKKEEDAE